MAKKRIAFLTTGGTIASVKTPEGLRPAVTQEEMVKLVPELSDIAEISGDIIMNIDSSNMQPEDWSFLAQKTAEVLEDFDGVVLTHGTDTMGYSASALSYMLCNLKKPVVMTGAQIPISQEENDARDNLIASFRVAATGKPGLFVVFNNKVIIGDRASKVKTKSFDAFYSINVPFVGKVEDDKVIWDDDTYKNEIKRLKKVWESIEEKRPELFKDKDTKSVVVYDEVNPKALLVKLYPGIEPKLLLFAKDAGYHSVLLEAFGAGGVPFREPRNLLPTIKELISSGIKVAVTTQVPFEEADLTIYEVGKKALEQGAVSTGDLTREAALVRLMLGID